MNTKKILLTGLASLGLIASAIGQSVPSYVPTNKLQAWWPFNGNANDESGNGNSGTVNSATLTADRNGNANSAYSFDGISNSITIPDSDSLSFNSNVFTISFWINWNPSSSQGLAILGKRSTQTSNFEFYVEKTSSISTSPNCIMPHTWNLGGANVYQFPTLQSNSSSAGTWEHYVVTAAGSSCKLYKNGVNLYSSNTPINSMGNSSGDLTIGTGGGWGGTSWMNGTLDDIGIWNRALTQSEISDLYNSLQVSTTEISTSNLFSVFPNPSKGKITLLTDKKLVGSNFTVYDIVGKSVLTGKIHAENTLVELENFSNGMYLLRVGDNLLQTIKIIKE